jgi:carbon storage regulator
MLVLSRKKNESIVINNDIVVTVVEIRGDKVRLGIVAPKEVPVHRQEVYEAIHGTRGGTEGQVPPTMPVKPVDSASRIV